MKKIQYKTKHTCASSIEFNISNTNTIHNLKFIGGCSGNLSAISKLLEGEKVNTAISKLTGNICGTKSTSCCDQLSIALKEAVYELQKF